MIFSLFVNYKSTSDEQLMKRVRLMNDEKAFNELHRRYVLHNITMFVLLL